MALKRYKFAVDNQSQVEFSHVTKFLAVRELDGELRLRTNRGNVDGDISEGTELEVPLCESVILINESGATVTGEIVLSDLPFSSGTAVTQISTGTPAEAIWAPDTPGTKPRVLANGRLFTQVEESFYSHYIRRNRFKSASWSDYYSHDSDINASHEARLAHFIRTGHIPADAWRFNVYQETTSTGYDVISVTAPVGYVMVVVAIRTNRWHVASVGNGGYVNASFAHAKRVVIDRADTFGTSSVLNNIIDVGLQSLVVKPDTTLIDHIGGPSNDLVKLPIPIVVHEGGAFILNSLENPGTLTAFAVQGYLIDKNDVPHATTVEVPQWTP